MLSNRFFDQDACILAKKLLGKIIYRKVGNIWLKARIIETEAYYLSEKASHSSLGLTPSRRAMFMEAGTIYMYHCRGRATMNISAKGEGNAVLVKSAYPFLSENNEYDAIMLNKMREFYNDSKRDIKRLCNGQTLLCQALDLRVKDWNEKNFDKDNFFIKDEKIKPKKIIETTRLGIPVGRDEHLPYRFIDSDFIKFCTKPIKL